MIPRKGTGREVMLEALSSAYRTPDQRRAGDALAGRVAHAAGTATCHQSLELHAHRRRQSAECTPYCASSCHCHISYPVVFGVAGRLPYHGCPCVRKCDPMGSASPMPVAHFERCPGRRAVGTVARPAATCSVSTSPISSPRSHSGTGAAGAVPTVTAACRLTGHCNSHTGRYRWRCRRIRNRNVRHKVRNG